VVHPRARQGDGSTPFTDAGGVIMQEARIPIIGLYDDLIVPIQGAIADDVMVALQADVTRRIQDGNARGLIVDVSGVETLDSFMTRNLRDLALSARLMGVTAVVSGLRPAVAITLVEMGLEIPGVHTALNLERALELLRATREEEARDLGELEGDDA
jgi:rsbT antagonist protein RsbS